MADFRSKFAIERFNGFSQLNGSAKLISASIRYVFFNPKGIETEIEWPCKARLSCRHLIENALRTLAPPILEIRAENGTIA